MLNEASGGGATSCQLIDACHYYVKQSGRRISFEWALIAGQNDDDASARELAWRLRAWAQVPRESDPAQPDQGGFDGHQRVCIVSAFRSATVCSGSLSRQPRGSAYWAV